MKWFKIDKMVKNRWNWWMRMSEIDKMVSILDILTIWND